MIAVIAKKEFICRVRDGRFRWIAAIMALLLLSSFDIGISNYVGGTVWVEAHKTNFAKNRPAQDNGGLSQFGELTPAMAVIPAPYIMICGVLVPLEMLLVAVLSLYTRRIVVAEKSFARSAAPVDAADAGSRNQGVRSF